MNGCIASQPDRQHRTDCHPNDSQQQAENRSSRQRLPQQGTRTMHVAGSDPMGHLNGKCRRSSRAYPGEKPGRCRHQPNGSRCFGSQTADHRRIDILHDDGRQLRNNRRNTELHRQAQLLSQGQRLTIADQCKQPVGLF
ncbi:unknown [Bacteroides sp. CAG:633]|nr:unknown [Bacteroides sp. CAG:633]